MWGSGAPRRRDLLERVQLGLQRRFRRDNRRSQVIGKAKVFTSIRFCAFRSYLASERRAGRCCR